MTLQKNRANDLGFNSERFVMVSLSVLLITLLGLFLCAEVYSQMTKGYFGKKPQARPANVTASTQKTKEKNKLQIHDTNNPIPECQKAANKDGLYREVYVYLKDWALNPEADSRKVSEAVLLVCRCMSRLNEIAERDAWFEKVLKAHKDKPLVLRSLAMQNLNHSNGTIIDDQFVRGSSGGDQVSSEERDRVWSLRRMAHGAKLLEVNSVRETLTPSEQVLYYQGFLRILSNHDSWKLQILTNLEKTPDYDDGYRQNNSPFAPVDADGNPIFYSLPKTFDQAKSDGERLMWILEQMSNISLQGKIASLRFRSDFAQRCFGVQTLTENRHMFRRDLTQSNNQSAIMSLETLADDETIAYLANGVKRFKLPAGYNYIAIMKQLYDLLESPNARLSMGRALAVEYLNRRQYPKAAAQLKSMFSLKVPADMMKSVHNDYDKIVGNWGCFDPTRSKAAGMKTDLFWTFRNGNKVTFTASRIDIPALIRDIKSYLKTLQNGIHSPIDYNTLQIDNIGYRLILEEGNATKYLKETEAEWDLVLDPAKNHFDKQVAVELPFSKPGAWLVQAEMADGNQDAIVVWINDTAIVEKPLDNAILYYITDAKTGKPLPRLKLDFFTFNPHSLDHGTSSSSRTSARLALHEFTAQTDSNGQHVLSNTDDRTQQGGECLIQTSTENDKQSERFAWLGFKSIWFGSKSQDQFNQDKAFIIFDRPVYRPKQKVEYKIWLGKAQFDLPDISQWANKKVWLTIRDPRYTVMEEREITLDDKGGYTGSLELKKDVTLGRYQVNVSQSKDQDIYGHAVFYLEEYRKPEYEVQIDAPKDPVALGEKFTAKISARYYFGAPVTNAKVKYTVTRTKHDSSWYPVRPWDWFYGNGYWWFGSDYEWYPGWKNWGCLAPHWPWLPWQGGSNTEVVASETVPITPDGTVDVVIDSTSAKTLYPDDDQKYTITAEVTDSSRRVIEANSSVFVPRTAFKVYTWLHGGFFEPGQQINASVQVRRLDGKAVSGSVEYKLYRITYQIKNDGQEVEPIEKEVWSKLGTIDESGLAQVQLLAATAGQYRFSAKVSDAKGRTAEGAYIFTIHGHGTATQDNFEFNALELIPDKEEYRVGDVAKLLIGSKQKDASVLLFTRSVNGICSPPQLVTLDGKSQVVELAVEQADMPNFFVEALTVFNGNVYTAMRQIVVPPEKRILNVEVLPSKETYLPGEKAKAKIRITDQNGTPVSGQAVVSIYDKSLEYIHSSSIPNICEFFWKWQRSSHSTQYHNLSWLSLPIRNQNKRQFTTLGLFGKYISSLNEDDTQNSPLQHTGRRMMKYQRISAGAMLDMGMTPMAAEAPMNSKSIREENSMVGMGQKVLATEADSLTFSASKAGVAGMDREYASEDKALIVPAIRSHFADTAFWTANLNIAKDGTGNIELAMPENLTTWKINAWVMASGTKVGQGTTEVITKKNLLIRMQKPRFLIQGDTVVLSANVHNYLREAKKVRVSLEFPTTDEMDKSHSPAIKSLEKTTTRDITVPAGGEQRVDWKVQADTFADATVLMKALTDEESDAMQDTLAIHVHGMTKQDAVSAVIPSRPESTDPISTTMEMKVPEQCRPNETKLTIRFSPTLAGAILESLPYLASYPYGCTEQTLNRFVPTVIVRKTLQESGLSLAQFSESRNNLNSQELGDTATRARQWKKLTRSNDNPVFDEREVERMVREGLEKLTQMQCSDGGWGWFSGYGERSDAYLTGLVVRGLVRTAQAGIEVDSNVLKNGIQWLVSYQQREAEKIINGREWSAEKKNEYPLLWKSHADNTDAFVWSVLIESSAQLRMGNDLSQRKRKMNSGQDAPFSYSDFMKEEIWNVRADLSLLLLAHYGVALTTQSDAVSNERADHCIRMLSQYLKQDDENQTAWLDLGSRNGYCWWSWHGSPFETQAEYLKLLVRRQQNSDIAPRLVKYLLNNRKNATYWNSTRDTAYCLEAFCEYMKQTAELQPDTSVEIKLDGKLLRKVHIDSKNLFSFDNTVVVTGVDIGSGTHTIEISQSGTNPLYCNAYLQYFTTEDRIGKTGLEVKIERRYYLLEEDKTARKNVAGGHGQVVSERIEKYTRSPLADLAQVESGKLIEVELIIESKNDYESLLIEDLKAAGFEPVDLRSGYNGNELGAYVEFRDERVCFFVHRLAQGRYSVSYRLRAEQPGQFSALPARIAAMYAPELKGNSDEFKTIVIDAPSVK